MHLLHQLWRRGDRQSRRWTRWNEALCRWLCRRPAPPPAEGGIRFGTEDGGPPSLERRSRRAELLHRLKTPLLGIRQLSELLPQTEALSGDGQRKVDIIRRTAVEGMNIVDELLAPASSPPLPRTVEDVDLGRLVRAVATRLRPTAEYKRQRIHCAVAKECRVRGEGERLREVIENLLGNALKYSPRHAHVSVRVGRGNGTVQLIVADKGPGLRAADQRRLFKPFPRLPVRPTGGEGSSGLGLYFTKRIVEAHGGRIGVVSAPGRGSTFVVVLPESPVPSGKQEETA